jgi:hypothetical protein
MGNEPEATEEPDSPEEAGADKPRSLEAAGPDLAVELRTDSFTAADMRNFLITVAGTVVGGILLAMVLAVAVLLAKAYRDPKHYQWIIWSVVFGGPFVVIPIRDAMRKAQLPSLLSMVLPTIVFWGILFFLGLLGFAVGIK